MGDFFNALKVLTDHFLLRHNKFQLGISIGFSMGESQSVRIYWALKSKKNLSLDAKNIDTTK